MASGEYLGSHNNNELDRRKFIAGGLGALAAVGGGAYLLGSRSGNRGGHGLGDLDPSSGQRSAMAEQTPEVQPTSTPEYIRIEDLLEKKDKNLYANLNLISPTEVGDAIRNGTEQDLKDIFGIPPEEIVKDGRVDPGLMCSAFFARVGIALRVGFDEYSIEDYLNHPEGRQLYIQDVTSHDEKIARIIANRSEGEYFKKVLKAGHVRSAGRFYDNATAPNPENRNLNEIILVNSTNARDVSAASDYVDVISDVEISNTKYNIGQPLARGEMMVSAKEIRHGFEFYLAPAELEGISPFERI